MAEKGDLSSDTVSLPPTYAPSEAYSESPPPAYKRGKSTTVQVARMVCITLLVAAFMIGFFTLTSNYLSAKQCDCGHKSGHHEHGGDQFHAASFLPQVEKLVGNKDLNKVQDMNGNGIEGLEEEPEGLSKVLLQPEVDEVAVPDAQEELQDNIPEEEVESLVEEAASELEEIERELEEEEEQVGIQDIMKQQIDDMKKKIKLPIDLILGNPALAGRDVNCEVERRQQPIGGGIVTQAIIVTCSDNDDTENVEGPGIIMAPPGPRRLGPPLSLLAPIMKMLSARARSRVDRPIQIKTMSGPKPFPLPSGPQPCSPNGPFPCFIMNQPKSLGPFPGPMNGPMPGPINGPIPGPFSSPMPNPFNGPFPGPMNGQFSGPMNGHFSGPMNGKFSGPMNGKFSGPMNGKFSGPINGHFTVPMNGQFSGPMNGPFPVPMNGPFSGPMSGPNQGPISRHIHIPINGPKPNDLPSPFRGPMPFPSNGPIPSGPKSMFESNEDNEPRNRMLPFALRPLLRMSPRMPRILAFATNPDRQGLLQTPIMQVPISALQRGANNIASREPKIISVVNPPPSLPEAQGRALPSPVTLPGLRILPARLLSTPAFMRGMRREDSRPMTHMEMRLPEPENKVPDFEPRFPDFGPPRVHTVIGPNQPRIISQFPPNMLPKMEEPSLRQQIISKSISVNGRPISMEIMSPPKPIALIHKPRPIAGPQMPIFPPPPPPPPPSARFPPPPPKMDPEGRTGSITHINPDAEFIIHSRPPPRPIHSQPPPSFIHSQPPPSFIHAQPPSSPIHSQPPPSPIHSQPPPSFIHSQPPSSFIHSQPPPSFIHAQPPSSPIHSQPPPSPIHSQPPPSPIHSQAPQMTTKEFHEHQQQEDDDRKHHLLVIN